MARKMGIQKQASRIFQMPLYFAPLPNFLQALRAGKERKERWVQRGGQRFSSFVVLTEGSSWPGEELVKPIWMSQRHIFV